MCFAKSLWMLAYRRISAQKAVNDNGVKLMLGFNRRFDPNFARVRSLINDGSIGDPHIVKVTSRDPAPPLEYVKVSGAFSPT